MIGEWTKVACTSAKNVATTMGFGSCEVGGGGSEIPDGLGGAFVPLVGQQASMQLGVMASPPDQESLARIILQMEDDEETDRDCIMDAIGELTNCMVGQMKVAMRKVDPSLKIGLPVFIEGSVEDIGGVQQRVLEAQLDGIPVSIVVLAKDG